MNEQPFFSLFRRPPFSCLTKMQQVHPGGVDLQIQVPAVGLRLEIDESLHTAVMANRSVVFGNSSPGPLFPAAKPQPKTSSLLIQQRRFRLRTVIPAPAEPIDG